MRRASREPAIQLRLHATLSLPSLAWLDPRHSLRSLPRDVALSLRCARKRVARSAARALPVRAPSRRAPSLCIENPMICNKMIVLDVRRDVASSPRPGSRLARAPAPGAASRTHLRDVARRAPRARRPARSRRRSGARGPHDPQCGPISDLRPAAGRARAGGRVVAGSPRRPRLRYSNTDIDTPPLHTEAARDATRTAPSTAPTERCETPPPTSVLLASAPHGFGCTNAGSQ